MYCAGDDDNLYCNRSDRVVWVILLWMISCCCWLFCQKLGAERGTVGYDDGCTYEVRTMTLLSSEKVRPSAMIGNIWGEAKEEGVRYTRNIRYQVRTGKNHSPMLASP